MINKPPSSTENHQKTFSPPLLPRQRIQSTEKKRDLWLFRLQYISNTLSLDLHCLCFRCLARQHCLQLSPI
ncbi:hypothetical protein Nepgr_007466 [Nepenthes gracilis]|uniref:Uncharacterized protein n=1 Tax=Nepenthes gracilis TaxID=150966 RepID=A0AAD3XIJ7_NEPGR|nr:hypothetical protein Nepgr_007466 [Nepenthes gracilis]